MNETAVNTFPELSIVVPMYNEEECIQPFFRELLPVLSKLTDRFEVLCINDGSSDGTLELLKQERRQDNRIRIIGLSRNFGKEAALTAGLHFARGAAVVPMDADLQDPPQLINALVEKWRQGYDVVHAVRKSRRKDGGVKRLTASGFYFLIKRISEVPIPAESGDFRLMDRRVVRVLDRFPERTRFMKGLFASLGFRQGAVEYDREERAAGKAKWRYWKLWNLAVEGITSFSSMPLRIWSYVGILLAVAALAYAATVIIKTLLYGIDVPGYASIIVCILFFSGLQLFSIGILGEYVSRIFIEVKKRPLYIIDELHGIANENEQTTGAGCIIATRSEPAALPRTKRPPEDS